MVQDNLAISAADLITQRQTSLLGRVLAHVLRQRVHMHDEQSRSPNALTMDWSRRNTWVSCQAGSLVGNGASMMDCRPAWSARRGSRCHSSSVTKGMKGCSSLKKHEPLFQCKTYVCKNL